MLRRVAGLVSVAVVALGLLTYVVGPAQADPDCLVPDPNNPGGFIYICGEEGQPGGPGGPPGGGGPGGPPPCDLVAPYDEFCDGTAACWGNDPAAIPPSESLAGPRPSPEHHMAYKSCKRPDGSTYNEWFWSTGRQEPSPAQRAQAALGRLQIPLFTPRFNPPTRTLVNLDTWWWAEGGLAEVQGTPALGVSAVAFDGRMEVDPGDGSGSVTCPLTSARSDACTHVYRKASRAGYTASMRLVYSLRFELVGGGAFPTPPGLPVDFGSPTVEVTVPVREVQSVVQPND